jgi:hypothetical protein
MKQTKPMTPSEMALKAHANRRKKMSKEEISKHYSWVAGHRKSKKKVSTVDK